MNSTSAPRVATWMLRRFGSGPNIDATIGDLVERYHSGAGRLWYWRQVLGTVAVSAFTEVRSHKLVALRTVVLGTLAADLFVFATFWFYNHLQPDRYTLWLLTRRLPYPQSDWNIYEPYFQYLEKLYWYLMPLLMHLFAGLLTGWTVGRLSRPYQTAMLFLYTIVAFGWSSVSFLMALPMLRSSGESMAYAWYWLNSALMITAVLIGALPRRSAAKVFPSPSRFQ